TVAFKLHFSASSGICAARSLCCAARNAVVLFPVFSWSLHRARESLRRA
ncbi:hypothetical protein A2U01_0056143, partial [Trifolium medium]|nr:hypothetical protein [Trifolium medium]